MIASGDFTAGSHAALIAACLISAWRMMGLARDVRAGRVSHEAAPGLPVAAAMTMCAFVLERSYYLAARVLSPEFNLWELHPAPQMLSLMVAIYVIRESHAALKRRGFLPRIVRRARATDFALMLCAWAVGFSASLVI